MDESKFDEVDSHILRVLSENPRAPYQKIADELADEGHDMSGEGVRYRVSKLTDATTAFFLLDPEDVSWEIVRVSVRATDAPGAKHEAFERVSDLPFWHVTLGIGTYDVYAVGMAPTLADIEELVTTVREFESVGTVDHIVVTERHSDLDDYYYRPDEE